MLSPKVQLGATPFAEHAKTNNAGAGATSGAMKAVVDQGRSEVIEAKAEGHPEVRTGGNTGDSMGMGTMDSEWSPEEEEEEEEERARRMMANTLGLAFNGSIMMERRKNKGNSTDKLNLSVNVFTPISPSWPYPYPEQRNPFIHLFLSKVTLESKNKVHLPCTTAFEVYLFAGPFAASASSDFGILCELRYYAP